MIQIAGSAALLGELYSNFQGDVEPEEVYEQTLNIGHQFGTIIAGFIDFWLTNLKC